MKSSIIGGNAWDKSLFKVWAGIREEGLISIGEPKHSGEAARQLVIAYP